MVGEGYQIKEASVCKNIKLSIQWVKIIQDLLPVKLGNVDVILGIKWLSGLGEIKTN